MGLKHLQILVIGLGIASQKRIAIYWNIGKGVSRYIAIFFYRMKPDSNQNNNGDWTFIFSTMHLQISFLLSHYIYAFLFTGFSSKKLTCPHIWPSDIYIGRHMVGVGECKIRKQWRKWVHDMYRQLKSISRYILSNVNIAIYRYFDNIAQAYL